MYEDHEEALKKKMYQRYDKIKLQNPKSCINFDTTTGLVFYSSKRIQEVNAFDIFGTTKILLISGQEKYNKIIDPESDIKLLNLNETYFIDKLFDQHYNLNSMFTIGDKYKFTIVGVSLLMDHMGNERLFKMSDFRVLK